MACSALASLVEVWSDATWFTCTFKSLIDYLLACQIVCSVVRASTTFTEQFEDKHPMILYRAVHT